MHSLAAPKGTYPENLSAAGKAAEVEALYRLDRFEETRPAHRPYDWSLDRTGQAFHIEPISHAIPADLDPDLAPALVPLYRQIRLADSRQERIDHLRAMMLGITAATLLAALSLATLTAAAIRLPQIEQQLADAARI